ncbi:hypothetical protein RhiirA1_408178 [Rhizophagus irregularis]|uniref:Uncharacterized protein n=4 Tax=Rhizophagus irregularis TaxID=588596 RepID=A0A2I1F3L6_9GLOM|nr:hypothetical protein GLOIN_2v1545114 [Rhizophagus irregularis DAOM 181602=DAOM 197198]EXX52022.1 hypothetical protein RirG_256730 [Rhizophagus irregularis DAOM 197198w]PKC75091.1 hypothetical protein RhiirA1_408178 [Rhizophagus irregularis]PKY28958.1 hypothetical protein RhiirB3_417562 [Rhizophagus irregularis]POG77728.1 hypothetical protein GLOIN_2v1545114 [Rhizophagus irregularis DAOM 181602=DAOM 197198]UZO15631.1 hypothetical protein OCT59_007048 [Rhizophagus irregularis]|eukprot:XP_025184594.1 hypothetical protein GLOIN_2v1545114 [Rhizophagus irregularis DAOM 181602=DAOM 197198]
MLQKDDKDPIKTMKFQFETTIFNKDNSDLGTMNNLKEFNGSIDVKNEIEEKDCLWNNTAIIVCIAVGIGAIAIAAVVTLAMIITDQDLTAVIKCHSLIGTISLSIGSHLWSKNIKGNKLILEELEEAENPKIVLKKPEQNPKFTLKKPRFVLKKSKFVLKKPEKPKFVLKQQKFVRRLY